MGNKLGVDVLEQGQRTAKPNVKLSLRTQHAVYLQHVARRDETSISHVISRIVSSHATVMDPGAKPARQECRHVTIDRENLQMLDCLSRALGIDRSETIRRLIDKAMTEDPMLRLVG